MIYFRETSNDTSNWSLPWIWMLQLGTYVSSPQWVIPVKDFWRGNCFRFSFYVTPFIQRSKKEKIRKKNLEALALKTKWNEFVVEEKLNGCKNTQFKYKETRSYYLTFYIDPVWLCVYKASSRGSKKCEIRHNICSIISEQRLVSVPCSVSSYISHSVSSCVLLNMMKETFTVSTDNLTTDTINLPFSNSLISDNEDSIWIIFLQESQLVVTIVGFFANIGTSTTLIKNGQVGVISIDTIVLIVYYL